MFGFGGKQDKKKTIIVISIESSQVRACFVDIQDGQKSYITKQAKASFVASQVTYVEYKKNMEQAIGVALSVLKQGMFAAPSQVFCVLGAPWYLASSHTHTIEEENPFEFNVRVSQDILHQETQRFISVVQNKYFAGLPVDVLEKKIIHIAVNGYPVTVVPKNKKIRRVDVVSYVSLTSEKLLKDIKESVHRHFQREVVFATSALSHFVVGRDVFESVGSFSYISITGEQTEISYIDEGSLISMANFPVGNNLLHKHASLASAHTHSVVSSIKHDQILKDKNISSVSMSAAREWQDGFESAVQNFSKNHPVQNTVVLICDKQYQTWFTSVIQDSRNKHLSVSNQNFRVIILNMEALYSYVGSKVPETDIQLAVHALFTTLSIS